MELILAVAWAIQEWVVTEATAAVTREWVDMVAFLEWEVTVVWEAIQAWAWVVIQVSVVELELTFLELVSVEASVADILEWVDTLEWAESVEDSQELVSVSEAALAVDSQEWAASAEAFQVSVVVWVIHIQAVSDWAVTQEWVAAE